MFRALSPEMPDRVLDEWSATILQGRWCFVDGEFECG